MRERMRGVVVCLMKYKVIEHPIWHSLLNLNMIKVQTFYVNKKNFGYQYDLRFNATFLPDPNKNISPRIIDVLIMDRMFGLSVHPIPFTLVSVYSCLLIDFKT